jgi:hypothetical protein
MVYIIVTGSTFLQFKEDEGNNCIAVYEGDAIIEKEEPIGYCKGLLKDYKTCADSAEVDLSNIDNEKLIWSIVWV